MFSGQLDNCAFVYIVEEMNNSNYPFQTPALSPRPPSVLRLGVVGTSLTRMETMVASPFRHFE